MAQATPPAAAAGDSPGEGTITDTAKLALLGIVAAVQAVPGYTILAGDDWQPPDAGMFRITAAVAGAALFAMVFMARRRLLRLRPRVVVAGCAGGFVAALALLYAYHALLEDRVVTFIFARQQFRMLLPFGVSHWARGEILEVVQQSNGGLPRTAAQVTHVHLQNALSEAGPGAVLDAVPQSWRQLTLGTLWLMYTAALGLIVVGFGTAAVRLGVGIAQKRRARAGPASSADSPAADDASTGATPAPGEDAPAIADAPSPAREEAEVVPAGAAMAADVRANGNGNGRLGEPVMLRVEFRAPAWAVASAAAALGWAAFRLLSRDAEPRRPPARPPRPRDPARRS